MRVPGFGGGVAVLVDPMLGGVGGGRGERGVDEADFLGPKVEGWDVGR